VHVLADAFTSVLAIVALAAGLWLGWSWLDPLMGIVGAGVILWWSKGLVGDSARVLLDREMDAPLVLEIRKAIEVDGDAEIAENCRTLRFHGSRDKVTYEQVGYNSRLDTLQAAVLSAKLPFLAEWSAARRAHAAYYDAAFADVPEIRPPAIDTANESIYNQYTIRTEQRDALQAHLKAKEIGTAIYYPIPLHLQQCFAYLGYKQGAFPESERAAKEVLSIPVYPELTQAQQDETIEAVRSFFGR